ncbi:MAG: methylmalonyl-CoA epimerase [Salinibacter sp.]
MASLEHVGIAVDDVTSALDRFADLLGERAYKTETVANQGVRTHFVDAGGAKLELLEARHEDSPVARFLDARGEGIHHVAFEVDDLETTMTRLRDAGLPLLNDSPQPGADDKRICFVHPSATHGVLVEFCDTPRTADWTPTPVPHREGTLAVYERGRRDRPTVLCLHGAAGTVRHDLAPLMRALEPQFHIVGVDLSGHGASALPPDGTLTIDRFVADAAAALDATQVESTHVFGFSMGASVGLRLAQTHPDRVDRLGLLSPRVDWTDALAETMHARLDPDDFQDGAPARTRQRASRHHTPERLMAALRAFVATLPHATDGALEALSELAAPTLVAALDDDPLFPLPDTHTLSQALPNARFAVLPGSRHALSAVPLDVLTPLLRHHFADSAPARRTPPSS